MEFQFDQEKYPRGAHETSDYWINLLPYSSEVKLETKEDLLNYISKVWPDEQYSHFKIEGTGDEEELRSCYIKFYNWVKETDEQYARRVQIKISHENEAIKHSEYRRKKMEVEVEQYVKRNPDQVKQWLENK